MLKLVLSLTLLSLIGCSSAPKLGKATGTGEKLSGPINIAKVVPYASAETIPKKIRTECTELGAKISDFAKSYGKEDGVTFTQANKVSQNAKGNNMVVKILNAHSSGNAFIGHNKSMTIKGSLYKDGKMVDEVELSRKSGGGIGAGYKGSCSVMGRVSKRLGHDLAIWAKKYSM